MNHYYGEGFGESAGYLVSFAFCSMPQSCEIFVYDKNDGREHYLSNERFVIGDRSDEGRVEPTAPWTRRRGTHLRILMFRMPDSTHHWCAFERIWMDFEISWDPAFVRVWWRGDSLRVTCTMHAGEGGSWEITRPPPPGNPELMSQQPRRQNSNPIETHAQAAGDRQPHAQSQQRPATQPGTPAGPAPVSPHTAFRIRTMTTAALSDICPELHPDQ